MSNQKSNHRPQTLINKIDTGKKQQSEEPLQSVRIELRVFGMRPFTVDAGYNPDTGYYHVGARVLTKSELRAMVQREHRCELVSIIHTERG